MKTLLFLLLAASVMNVPKGDLYDDDLVTTNVTFTGLASEQYARDAAGSVTNLPQHVTVLTNGVLKTIGGTTIEIGGTYHDPTLGKDWTISVDNARMFLISN